MIESPKAQPVVLDAKFTLFISDNVLGDCWNQDWAIEVFREISDITRRTRYFILIFTRMMTLI